MQTRSVIVLLFISFSILSGSLHASVKKCGYSADDTFYPNLDWEKVTTYNIDTQYATINALLCAGINRKSKKIERIHYRDNSGVTVKETTTALKRNDVIFLKQTDFPREAQLIIRSTPALTIKVTKDVNFITKRVYSISLKFVRNMMKGFSRTDIREIKLNVSLERKINGKLNAYITPIENRNTRFNHVLLSVSSTLAVESISFFDDQTLQKTFLAKSLAKATRD